MKLLNNKGIYITQIESLRAPQRKVCSSFRIIRNILINSVGKAQRFSCNCIYILTKEHEMVNKKVKQSRCRPGVAQRVPGS
jgi:hypothetical protein